MRLDQLDASKANALFESPSERVLRELVDSYSPTEDDLRLVLVYWAAQVELHESGRIPDTFISNDIPGEVLKLASKYPRLFTKDSTRTRIFASAPPRPLTIDPTTGAPTDGCNGSCIPPLDGIASTAASCMGGIAGIYAGLATLAKGSAELEKLKGILAAFEAISEGTGLLDKLRSAVTGDVPGLAVGLVSQTTSLIAFGATLGLASAPVAAGAIVVGAVAAIVQCGLGIHDAAQTVQKCKKWKAENGCEDCGPAGASCRHPGTRCWLPSDEKSPWGDFMGPPTTHLCKCVATTWECQTCQHPAPVYGGDMLICCPDDQCAYAQGCVTPNASPPEPQFCRHPANPRYCDYCK